MKSLMHLHGEWPNGETFNVSLYHPKGEPYYWLDDATGNSCEISAATYGEAVEAASAAWVGAELSLPIC